MEVVVFVRERTRQLSKVSKVNHSRTGAWIGFRIMIMMMITMIIMMMLSNIKMMMMTRSPRTERPPA